MLLLFFFFFVFFSAIHTHTTSAFSCSTYFQCYLPTYLPNPRIMVNYNKMKAGGGGGPPIKKKNTDLGFFFLKKKKTLRRGKTYTYIPAVAEGGWGWGI